ncbi:MAG: hypothetical protein ABI634_00900 [Acidobacteriota bacterium]
MTTPERPRQYVALVLIAIVSGAVAALLLLGATHWASTHELRGPVADGGWTGRTRGWLAARGFFPIEVDARTGARYSWTGETARISIPNINRGQAHAFTLVLSGGRPGNQPNPLVTLTVDGAPAASCLVTNEPSRCVAAIPAGATDRAVIGLQVSPAYVPGAPDTRTLGVIAHELALTPASGHFVPTWPVLGAVGSAVAFAVLGVLLCGVSGAVSTIAVAGITSAFVWLLLQDGAYIGGYADSLLNVGLAAGMCGALAAAVRRRWPVVAGVPDWSMALGLLLAATVVKLGFFNHPLATIGDGIFQLHRAQMVRAGSYFFTSITPRPFFEFPYAIGLYVAALPFWSHFPSDIDQVHLLRGVAVGADALVGMAWYFAVCRQWSDRRAALLVAGLWPFARAPLEALCNSNLTNVFAQALFGVAMAGIAWMAAGVSVPAAAITLAFLTAGYLSHFSTFSVGVPLVGVVACVLIAFGRTQARRAGWWVLALGVVAVGLAYAVYYSHFTEVYRATWARIASHETVDATGSSIAATPITKLQRWASGTSDDYGLPGLVLAAAAAIGALELARRRLRDGVTLVLGGWLAIWMAFTVLGIVSAVQMRVNLAAAPLFVCLGACGLTALGARSRTGLLIAGVATVAIVVNGARLWLMCIGR